MSLLTTLTINCDNQRCSGGINKLYLISKNDITSIEYDLTGDSGIFLSKGNGKVAAVVFKDEDAGFSTFEFADFTGVFNQDAPAENCNYAITQTFEGTYPCQSQLVREVIQVLQDGSCCGFIGIVEDLNGKRWLWGDLERRRIKLMNSVTTTGANISDQNNIVFTFECKTTKLAVEWPIEIRLLNGIIVPGTDG